MEEIKEPWEGIEKQYWIVGCIYAINSNIGTGILSSPWALWASGWGYGIIFHAFAFVTGVMLCYIYTQALSRMEMIAKLNAKGYKINPVKFSQLLQTTKPGDFISSPDSEGEQTALINEEIKPTIRGRRIDWCEMATVLYGNKFGYVNTIAFCIAIYSLLIGWYSIVASSLASTIPIFGLETCNIYDNSALDDPCRPKYMVYLVLFALIMSIFVIVGFSSQVKWQISIFIVRIVIITLMVVTALYAIFSSTALDDDESEDANPPIFDTSHIGFTLPIILGSIYFQPLIPNLAQITKKRESNIIKSLITATAVLTILPFILGIIMSYTVDEVEKMASLNWLDYSGGYDQDNRKWWAYLIEYLIIIFPVIDIISAYPLAAICLSDNLLSLKYGHFDALAIDRKIYLIYRFAVIIPPAAVAIFVYDLSFVITICGLMAVVMSGIVIPLFSIATKKMVPQSGPFDGFFFSGVLDFAIISCSIFISIGLVVMILFYYLLY